MDSKDQNPSEIRTARPAWLVAAPFAFVLLWSGGYTFAKIGLQYSPPMTFLVLRFLCALAVLVPIIAVLRPSIPRRPSDWFHLAVIGFLIQTVYFGLSYVSFYAGISAGGLAVIMAMQPILVGLLAPRFAGEKVGLTKWIGLVLGLAGATIVIVARSEFEVTSYFGLLSALGALTGITAATLYERRMQVSHNALVANAIQYVVGFVTVLPVALLFETPTIQWTGEFLVALAYLVLGNSLISVTLLLLMLRHGEAARVSALFFLVPPLAALIAWTLIGEAMPLAAWGGMAVAALGVAIATGALAQLRKGPFRAIGR
ncbi:MAG: DMT family transporter [Parvibaculaceae bacterium]